MQPQGCQRLRKAPTLTPAAVQRVTRFDARFIKNTSLAHRTRNNQRLSSRCSRGPEAGMLSGIPESAVCVQKLLIRGTLQFTVLIAFRWSFIVIRAEASIAESCMDVVRTRLPARPNVRTVLCWASDHRPGGRRVIAVGANTTLGCSKWCVHRE